MGTTLTGTTPQDTYDSLIKVTDNGPLSSTAKYLSDGLGNDSTLALSTGNIGIGTTNPSEKLDLQGTMNMNAASGTYLQIQYNGLNRGYVGTANAIISGGATTDFGLLASSNLIFGTGGSSFERMRITASGNVGIGTSSPSDKLHVSGSGNTATFITGSGCTTYVQSVTNETRIGNLTSGGGSIVFSPADAERVRITSNGLTFNGDTAAANALDDYEEGTWTPSFVMGTSGTVTMGDVLGRYTKVGNLVTCTGYANAASVSSPVGELRIAGLPFTTGTGGDSSINIYAYGFGNTTAVTAYQGFTVGTLNYAIVRGFVNGDQVQNIGANVVGSAGMIFTITYRV